MTPTSSTPQRARRAALTLLALLALVLIVRLLVGLPAIVFFGLAGGLVFSLVIIGLDLLHNAARKLDTERDEQPGDTFRR
jgi:uncharacterized protein (DUF58 family)